jgi:hypothetical protein
MGLLRCQSCDMGGLPALFSQPAGHLHQSSGKMPCVSRCCSICRDASCLACACRRKSSATHLRNLQQTGCIAVCLQEVGHRSELQTLKCACRCSHNAQITIP